MYEEYEFLKFERRGRILVVTMTNPPLNPMTPKMHNELSRIFTDINRDDETAVVVLTGAEKGFSAGGNIKNMQKRIETQNWANWFEGVNEAKNILRSLLRLEKPLIGRVNGHAMGLGASLAVFCDISFMLETAKIADTHVKVGLVAGDGGSLMWPLLMGHSKAKQYLFTGDVMTGKEAAELGLITHSCATEAELDEKVYSLAERLATGATKAIAWTKMATNMLLIRQLDELIEKHLEMETQSFFTADHKEAVFAMNEKREPKFIGK